MVSIATQSSSRIPAWMPSGYESVARVFDNGPSGHVISNFRTSGSSNLTD